MTSDEDGMEPPEGIPEEIILLWTPTCYIRWHTYLTGVKMLEQMWINQADQTMVWQPVPDYKDGDSGPKGTVPTRIIAP